MWHTVEQTSDQLVYNFPDRTSWMHTFTCALYRLAGSAMWGNLVLSALCNVDSPRAWLLRGAPASVQHQPVYALVINPFLSDDPCLKYISPVVKSWKLYLPLLYYKLMLVLFYVGILIDFTYVPNILGIFLFLRLIQGLLRTRRECQSNHCTFTDKRVLLFKG